MQRRLTQTDVDGLADAFRRSLGSPWVPVAVDFRREIEIASLSLRIDVADMVPCLRHFHELIEEWRANAHDAYRAVRRYIEIVDEEREVRRWSSVDP